MTKLREVVSCTNYAQSDSRYIGPEVCMVCCASCAVSSEAVLTTPYSRCIPPEWSLPDPSRLRYSAYRTAGPCPSACRRVTGGAKTIDEASLGASVAAPAAVFAEEDESVRLLYCRSPRPSWQGNYRQHRSTLHGNAIKARFVVTFQAAQQCR